MVCAAQHPETGQPCIAESAPDAHYRHFHGYGSERVYWDNEDFRHPADRAKADAEVPQVIGRAIARANGSGVVDDESDWNSRIAHERVMPTKGTKRYRVLAALLLAEGDWVPGTALASDGVGGSEGLRRCRELRTECGWPVQRRPSPDSDTTWDYRLPMG